MAGILPVVLVGGMAAVLKGEAPEPRRSAGRPVDLLVLQHVGVQLNTGVQRDIAPDAIQRVDLYQDPGHPVPNRAEVDLDRDGQFDERWTLSSSGAMRAVAPNDDGRFTETWIWSGTAWVISQ